MYIRWRRIPAIALDYSRNRYRDVIILKPRDANFAVDNKKREKMFDDFDYDNYVTESTNEGFFMAMLEENVMPMYFTKGAVIEITADAKDVSNTLTYTGDNKDLNNYYAYKVYHIENAVKCVELL